MDVNEAEDRIVLEATRIVAHEQVVVARERMDEVRHELTGLSTTSTADGVTGCLWAETPDGLVRVPFLACWVGGDL